MKRLRLTQVFPCLLPLRLWQKKSLFYMQMEHDGHIYAKSKTARPLSHIVKETSSLMMNMHSGYDISYQFNKIHNLKLAAKTIDHLLIRPGETFSFWSLVRYADRFESFKDGLCVIDGQMTTVSGGGLCQLSGMLYYLFLHTPLTVIERHPHMVEYLPPTDASALHGIDATVNEGWQDLKVRNDTDITFQIIIIFNGVYMEGCILADQPLDVSYDIINDTIEYVENETLIENASVSRIQTDLATNEQTIEHLYTNHCQINYPLSTEERRGINHVIH